MKKIIRLTERDLTRIVKRTIREMSDDDSKLEELKNEIKTIYDYFENEVKEKADEKDGLLSSEVAEELIDTLEYYIGKIFDNKIEVKYLDEDDYFDLEDYAHNTISEFRSFINNNY
jgi:hypothetical protein